MKLLPLAVVISLTMLPSCTTKKYYEDTHYYDYGLAIDPAIYYVDKNDFTWNDNLFRWEYSFNDDYLTEFQLEEMEIAGTVIFTENNNRYFSPMPYVETYYSGDVHVVETIGYEVTRGLVTFYIQTNERYITRDWMYDRYEFKVSLFYWKE